MILHKFQFVMTEQIDGNQWLKYDRNAYKLNVMGGKKSTISEGGLAVAKHSGPRGNHKIIFNLIIKLIKLFVRMELFSDYFANSKIRSEGHH